MKDDSYHYTRGFAVYTNNPRLGQITVAEGVRLGVLISLENSAEPVEITLDQRVWLSPKGEVWLASESSPEEDEKRKLLVPLYQFWSHLARFPRVR